MEFKWEGVFPAVTTKFTQDEKLDIKMFEQNISAQLKAGVHGIVLGGTLGEASGLSEAEKEILIKTTVGLTQGKVPVIINIAEQTTSGAIRAAGNALNSGADGLMILPPMRYKADNRETVVYFKEVANSTDLPIMLYNNPVDYNITITLEMFDELAPFQNIQAVKESTRDITNVTRMINKFGDRYKILSGVDTLAMESLFMGAHGWVAGLVCAFPEETVAIYNLMKAGQYDIAREIYRWFLPLLELDINSKLVQNIKLAERLTNLGTEWVRKPRLPLQGEEREEVLAIIEKALATRPQLHDYKSLELISTK